MSKNQTIGSHIKLAHEYFADASLIGPSRRNCAGNLFYSIENLIMATLESEDIRRSEWRPKAGNHQLDRMIDEIPDLCSIKADLRVFESLTAYATTFRYPSPSGRIPRSPNVEMIASFLSRAETLVKRFTSHFDVDVAEKDPTASKIAPFRDSLDKDNFEP